MATILLTTSFPNEPILRQIPTQGTDWCRHRFITSPTDEPIDAWVVYDNLLKPETNPISRNRTLLVTGEPPSVRRYRSIFTGQFGAVRTSHPNVRHAQVVHAHEAQPWHYGLKPGRCHARVLDYDSLAAMPPPDKKKRISVISSNKEITEDHRQRLRFVEQLKSAFGDQIDVFGRGIRDVPDKADAIWEYQYHIVLENDHSPYYMSEKLPDAFLGWSFPFYSGSQYANRVFPADSFAKIDMYDPQGSIHVIRSHMQDKAYERRLSSLAAARMQVLQETNLFSVLCSTFDEMESRLAQQSSSSLRTTSSTTLFPKRKSFRLGMLRFMRALSVAA